MNNKLYILLLLSLYLCSCKTTTVATDYRDSVVYRYIYVGSEKVDSIHVHTSQTKEIVNDTVLITNDSIVYRFKQLTDTVFHSDTIRIDNSTTEKIIKAEMNNFQRFFFYVGIAALGGFILFLILKLRLL